MTRRAPRRLTLRRETLRRLADGDLARAAGGMIGLVVQRCTYEKSGCYGQTYTYDCTNGCAEQSWGGNGEDS